MPISCKSYRLECVLDDPWNVFWLARCSVQFYCVRLLILIHVASPIVLDFVGLNMKLNILFKKRGPGRGGHNTMNVKCSRCHAQWGRGTM